MSDTRRPIRRALISVYDKRQLEELAAGLLAAGVTLVSTGSTAARLSASGVEVTRVEEVTGFPEILDGRVKTLHPHVHGAILADQRIQAHREQLADLEITAFDLVVSNLYPFGATVGTGASMDECVEQIDIGGPAMVRAAAKNHPSVAVVTSPAQYADVLAAIAVGGFTLGQRQRLAAAAFAHTATYDVEVAGWFARQFGDPSGNDKSSEGSGDPGSAWPAFAGQALHLGQRLRYGENAHQHAALYLDPQAGQGLAQAEQLSGKDMSYNNYVDAESAHRTAYDFSEPAVAIIKHANPCGIAIGADVAEAHAKAHACDPVSAFGGVIAANRAVSASMARQVAEVFTEVVVAPEYDDEALLVLRAKKNVRILRCGPASLSRLEWRQIGGGFLAQEADHFQAAGDDPAQWSLVAGAAVDEAAMADLRFAWRACRAVKSNAILLAAGGACVGVGMGQVNRVDSARLAVSRAGDRAAGSVGASDAFFPFPDGLQVLVDAGVRAVVQPGGSMRDDTVVAAAEGAGIAMYLTHTRHFFH